MTDVAGFRLDELVAAQGAAGRPYHEFLRVPAIEAGIYVLPAGSDDPQKPHTEDELYYVVSGSARFRSGGDATGAGADDRAVAAGDVLYVAKHVEHRFHSITADLTVLVVFAPAR